MRSAGRHALWRADIGVSRSRGACRRESRCSAEMQRLVYIGRGAVLNIHIAARQDAVAVAPRRGNGRGEDARDRFHAMFIAYAFIGKCDARFSASQLARRRSCETMRAHTVQLYPRRSTDLALCVACPALCFLCLSPCRAAACFLCRPPALRSSCGRGGAIGVLGVVGMRSRQLRLLVLWMHRAPA